MVSPKKQTCEVSWKNWRVFGKDLKDHLALNCLPWAETPSTRSGCLKPYPAWLSLSACKIWQTELWQIHNWMRSVEKKTSILPIFWADCYMDFFVLVLQVFKCRCCDGCKAFCFWRAKVSCSRSKNVSLLKGSSVWDQCLVNVDTFKPILLLIYSHNSYEWESRMCASQKE